MAGFNLTRGDRLGLIGNFPALVRHAQSQGIPVTVVERKRHMLRDNGSGVLISPDPGTLAQCNKIICTAATLINATLDHMLDYCRNAEMLAMIGPSASCFAEPLFARGIHVLGGTSVSNGARVIAALRGGLGLRGGTRRYTLTPASYPGVASLVRLIRHGG
jgi:uncharacterized protein (DUF4213/DUF364 family)